MPGPGVALGAVHAAEGQHVVHRPHALVHARRRRCARPSACGRLALRLFRRDPRSGALAPHLPPRPRVVAQDARRARQRGCSGSSDRQVVAYALIGRSRAGAGGEIWELYVHPDCHGAGYGRSLFEIARDQFTAYGWEAVAHVWAIGLAIMAIVFFVFAKDDPTFARRKAEGGKPPSFIAQLEPLKKLQVWRFSLYYFFVFGGFVALALWLPNFLVNVYGVNVKVAGSAAAAFSLSASLFRAYGGHLSDRFGARTVMYWTFGFSMVFLFMLSYPPTDYVIHGRDGAIAFSTQMGLWPFIAAIFGLGFFMSLGKAAVFKHIPVYYPENVGAVGGLVGLVGG
ncbi:hypothetical protein CNY89_12355, partial [Amaricoccus sp. HAR-UPW-R2A-40]